VLGTNEDKVPKANNSKQAFFAKNVAISMQQILGQIQ
jgi:hypothetical protein